MNQKLGPKRLYVQYHKSGEGGPTISHDLLPGHETVLYLKADAKEVRLRRLANRLAAEYTCNCYDGECARCQTVISYRNLKDS